MTSPSQRVTIRRVIQSLVFFVPVASAAATPFNGPALDQALRAHDWGVLGPALSVRNADARDIATRDQWMAGHLRTDPNFFLAMLLSRDDWRLGIAMDGRDADAIKRQSGEWALLAIALIIVDGEECQDRSAPGHRLDQAVQQRASSIGYLRTLPAADRDALVQQAVAIEASTADRRDDSDLICRDGLSEMRAGLEHGSQTQIPPGSGYGRRTIVVQAPAGWQPSLLPADVYRPLQTRDRSKMPAALTKVAGG